MIAQTRNISTELCNEASGGAFSTIPASDSSLEPFLGPNFSASAACTTLDGFCSG
ncbi:MAG: hypothetical protein RMZ69_28550 [Nostoc sp. ChiQUE01a]|nr:hypothetical protein [Nostoc sp. ChiQUE01a]